MLKELITEEVLEPEQTGVFRASQAGMCETFLCHQMLGHEALPIPGRIRHVLDDGRTHERDIVTRLLNKGIEVKHSCVDGQVEVCCVARPYVNGHPDGIMRTPKKAFDLDYADANFKPGKFLLLEITAPNHFTYLRLVKQHLQEALYVKYVQVQLYLCSPEVKSYGTCAVVVVKNKNTSALYEEGVSFNQDVVLHEITKLRHVEALVARNQVSEFRCDDWRKDTCRYRQLCFVEEEEPTFVPTGEHMILKGETLAEAQLLLETAGAWRRGKELKDEGEELIQDSREQFRQVIEDYACKGLTVQDVRAMMVEEGITRSCDFDKLQHEFPDAYATVVSSKRRERYVRVS